MKVLKCTLIVVYGRMEGMSRQYLLEQTDLFVKYFIQNIQSSKV